MKMNDKRILSVLCLLLLGPLAGCGSGSGYGLTSSKSTSPAITQQPTNQTVTAGNTATFAASASGTPAPTVQWQVSTNGGAFTNITGATSGTLMVTGTTASQNGNKYQAVFTNSVGNVTTTAATLTVNFAPQITQQPTNQAVAAGKTATFSASASGNPAPTVQWQVSVNGGAFTNITGATSGTLMVAGTTASQNGNKYQAVFTNSVSSTTTTTATLTVNAPAVVNGAAFDGPVLGATINAYSISSTGVVGTTPIASTVTSLVDGSYSLTLPAGFSGPVLLTSLGGTYKDDVTGQIVQAAALSVLLPSAMGNVTAELTPLTSMAAQLALQLAAAAQISPASIANNLNSAIGALFGQAGSITGTPLVDVSTANCASTASQPSIDISLIIAGISQLAADNGVTSAALTVALTQDFSDGVFDGTLNGTPIPVPLANGSGSISLCTIEGNCPGSNSQLPQAIGAAVTAFENSVANACGAMMSPTTLANLNNPAFTVAFPPAGAVTISVSGTITGLNPGQSARLRVGTTGLPNHCVVTSGPGCPGAWFAITGTGNFSGVGGAPFSGFTGYELFLTVSDPGNENCQIARPIVGGVTPNAPVSINGIQITCSVMTYPVTVDVAGLTAGQTVQFQNFGTDTLTVTTNGFTSFSTQLTLGSAYNVTISAQPSSETCTVRASGPGSGMGTVGTWDTVAVTCGTATTTSLLSNPNGLALSNDQTLLYLANAGGNQVLVYNIIRNSATGVVTDLILVSTITADIVNPTRLAFDPTGQFLFVTNFGPVLSNGWVSVYDTANGNAEVTADKLNSGSISHPLGVAVDGLGNLYVAENARNAISVFQPQSTGGYQEASFSPLSADAAGDQFFAPGALSFYSILNLGDFLVAGTGAGNVLVYSAPLTNTSTPLYALSHGACATAPAGPTGFALLVGSIPIGPQSDSSFLVTDFFGGDVLEYSFNSFFGTSTCPAPFAQTTSGSNKSPEGVAIDVYRNVFVTNAGANSIFVYANVGLSAAPTLTVQ
ncbi:MAG: immunoglobulin domain-containing protein [Candidatus Acidiferrales bacterium]